MRRRSAERQIVRLDDFARAFALCKHQQIGLLRSLVGAGRVLLRANRLVDHAGDAGRENRNKKLAPRDAARQFDRSRSSAAGGIDRNSMFIRIRHRTSPPSFGSQTQRKIMNDVAHCQALPAEQRECET